MKRNKIYLSISLFSAILFALFLPTSLMAQSESYLDTIYRAVNGSNTYSSDYETDTDVEVLAETKEETSADSDTLLIYADVSNNGDVGVDTGKTSNPITADGKIDVNIVLSDMTRILIGMNTGLNINTSSFTIIDMGNGVLNTNTSTSSTTNTGTSTSTTTNTNTSTGTNTNTDTGTTSTTTTTTTTTNTNTTTTTSTTTNTSTSTGTNTPTDEPGLNPGTTTTTTTTTTTSTSTDTGSNPNPFGEDTTVTTTQTTSDTTTTTTTTTATNTNTGSDTSTGTNEDSKEEIDNLKAKIKSNYSIPVEDGDSKFTLKQLQLMDEVFSKMKAANSEAVNTFMKATTKIVRDKKVPDNATIGTVDDNNRDDVAGYVVKGKTEVHILDRAVTLSEKDIKELEDINKCKFSQAELVKSIEEDYVHTIVHEMTHAFQNAQKEKGNDLVAKWQEKFWESDTKIRSDGIAPTSYAKTAPYEDMAECVAFYVTGGGVTYKNENGKEVFAANDFSNTTMDIERYNWIKYNIFNGVEFLDPNSGAISF